MRMRYPGLVILAVIAIVALSGSFAAAKISVSETPTPSFDVETLSLFEGFLGPSLEGTPDGVLTPGLLSSAECANFNDNPPLNPPGFLFIPPDPHCAAGAQHIVNVGNCYIEWRLKNALVNVPQYKAGLSTFFAGVPGGLGTTGFDPKVIYDQYSNRFIVVALEFVAGPPLQSRIWIAVSKGADPNGGWWLHSIDSMINIGGVDRWADYPGIAIDGDAVYVTTNMFNAAGTSYAGVRLWLIQKAATYAGPNGSIVWAVYDPYGATGNGALATTSQPTHMYGPEPAGVGTFVVATS
jgi:hypothetical protein